MNVILYLGVVQCQHNHSRILGIIAFRKRGDVDAYIYTPNTVINIVEMGEGDTFFLIFPIILTI